MQTSFYCPMSQIIATKLFSGILLEAIQFGKIPVVQEGTWMAQELQKYKLDSLIIDWSDPDLAEKLVSLVNDAEVQHKIRDMQDAYRRIHCSANFAKAMVKLHGTRETVVPFPSDYITNEQGVYPFNAVE